MFRRSVHVCAALASRAVNVARHHSLKPLLTPAQAQTQHACTSVQSITTCARLMCSTSFNLNDYEDFQERVLQSETPVVVDFYATWCGPCKMLTPRLESIVDSRDGQVLLAKADVDQCDFAMDYEVMAVPTVIAFKGGQPVAKFMGMKSDHEINAFLDEVCEM